MTQPNKRYARITRSADLVLLVLSTPLWGPLFLVIGTLCLLTQGRPIFFTQDRLGLNAAPFRILKFRTMIRDADQFLDAAGMPTTQRVTRTGVLLRRTGLDELPQLLNVLRGDMSLVGPRPVLPEWLQKIPGGQAHPRFELRPGLTGPAQVAGRNTVVWSVRLEYDRSYCESPEVVRYFKVLALTPAAVLRPTVSPDRNAATVDDLVERADGQPHRYGEDPVP